MFIDHSDAFFSLRKKMKSSSVYDDTLTEEDIGEKPKYVLLDEALRKVHVKVVKNLGNLELKYSKTSVLVHDFANDGNSEIEVLSETISKDFVTYQQMVKKMFPKEYKECLEQEAPLPPGETYASLQIRKGLQQTHMVAFAELMQKYRKMQIDHESHQRKGGGAFSFNDDGFETYTRGLTSEQEMTVANNQQQVNTRINDFKQLHRSVQEIAQIFEELHMMVVDQGTLLDRVDQNLAMAENETREAVKEIEKANEHQKAARFKMCILLLMLLIVGIVVGVIVFKSVMK